MDDLHIQVNIYGWSLRKLVDESIDLPMVLKIAGFDTFAIAEVHSMKAQHRQLDEEIVVEEETFALNTDELENKRPFCSTPRTSLLTPVPFPPVEASRISANPGKIIEWISRRENTRETLTEMIKTEASMSTDSHKSREWTFKNSTSFVQSNNDLNDVILEDNNEQNVSFHSVSSSIPDESEEIQILHRTEENAEDSEQDARSTLGIEKVSRNFDATIQLGDLKTYSSSALSRDIPAQISNEVYELLTPMQIDSPYQDLFKPLPEPLSLHSPFNPESHVHDEDEGVVMGTAENDACGQEDQDPESFSDADVDVESVSENRDVNHIESTPNNETPSEVSCQFPGCGTRMKWRPKFGKRRLIDHAVTHVNEAQFKCHLCSLESLTYRTMAYHYKKNHRDFKFKRFGIRSIEKSPETIVSIWQECYSRDVALVGTMDLHESVSSKRKHRRKALKPA